MATAWNKEQADLLRRIALGGGSCAASKCQGPALGALIEAGFVTVQIADRVARTDAGLARARELRSPTEAPRRCRARLARLAPQDERTYLTGVSAATVSAQCASRPRSAATMLQLTMPSHVSPSCNTTCDPADSALRLSARQSRYRRCARLSRCGRFEPHADVRSRNSLGQ